MKPIFKRPVRKVSPLKRHLVGLAVLRRMFRADQAPLQRLARQQSRFESKATRKGHIHKHNPPGTKMRRKRYGTRL